MERIENTYYYDETITREDYKNKEKRKGLVCLKLRVPEEYHIQLNEVFPEVKYMYDDGRTVYGSPNLVFLKRNHKEDIDSVDEFDFDVIPYDNRVGDVIRYHTNIICKLGQEEEIKEKIIKIAPHTIPRNSNSSSGLSISVVMYKKEQRGIWTTNNNPTPKYPICILSYDRCNEYGYTHMKLTKLKINHYLFIDEKQEKDYKDWYDPEFCKIILCPEGTHGTQMGGTPVRNFILKFGREQGFDRVWMLDDNIQGWKRLYRGQKNDINSSVIFTHVEDYIERYDNVGLVSHNHAHWIAENNRRVCICMNSKCYSSLLCLTDKEFEFEDKFNEDVLISIKYIQKGLPTVIFNSVLYDKDTSGSDKGGNQSIIYEGGSQDGYKKKFDYLVEKVKILHDEGRLDLVEGKTPEQFVINKPLKTKLFHHKVFYNHLKNHSVKFTKKDNYEEIKSQQKREIEFIFTPNEEKEKNN